MTAVSTILGEVTIRPVHADADAPLLHRWLTHPRSAFWGQQNATEGTVRDEYRRIAASATEQAVILELDGEPIALAEVYDPAASPLAPVVELRPGDQGMHILVAPPSGDPRPGTTDALFAALMRWLIDVRRAPRVVVEPDVRNEAVHRKNAAAGFRDLPGLTDVDLGEKHARIQACTAAAFRGSRLAGIATVADGAPRITADHLLHAGPAAEHALVAKLIREFAHERLIHPERVAGTEDRWTVQIGSHRLAFAAREHRLEHLSVDPESISSAEAPDGAGAEMPRLVDLVGGAAEELGIPQNFLHIYLEEVAATLAGRARTAAEPRPSVATLADAPGTTPREQAEFLQFAESAMYEGHPGFIANAGRGGMSETDLARYAPELGRSTPLVWLAAKRSGCVVAGSAETDVDTLFAEQLGPQAEPFRAALRERGLDPSEYVPLPLHPWQWENRVTTTFASSLMDGSLVYLGPGCDLMHPQQSLRTYFNLSRPELPYVKTAAAVRNMGFVRGLSPEYMETTPAINDWLYETLGEDPDFQACNVRLLREIAAVGFVGDVYHRTFAAGAADTRDNMKMLAALWRESPIPLLPERHQAITLAAILYRDAEDRPLVGEWIRRAGATAEDWVRALLRVYLRPTLRALAAHDVVFMPHCENTILELADGMPVGSFFKDLGEEIAVVRASHPIPARLERIQADHGEFDEEQRVLSLHTDVVDGVLRHLAALMDDAGLLAEDDFWRACTECVLEYEQDYPGTVDQFPMLAPTFKHSCLNRLQLKNPTGMVNLGDQNSSLLYAGRIENPLHR